MGKRVTIEYEDDLGGGAVAAEDVVTVNFSVRGDDYTLVLSPENGAQYEADMARWITAAKKAQTREAREARKKAAPTARKKVTSTARKATPVAKKAQPEKKRIGKPATATRTAERRTPVPAVAAAAKDQNRAIREWAEANGHNVSKRGRISAEVIDAFNAAH